MAGRWTLRKDKEGAEHTEYDDPQDAGKPITADEVQARFQAASKATRRQQMAYWVACAFIEGDQWLKVSDRHTSLRRVTPERDRQILAVNNRLLPASVTIMAKLHRRPHVFEVEPRTSDDPAVLGARLGRSVLADCQRRQDWPAVRTSGDWIAWKAGTALLCVEWDGEAGDLAYDTTPGEGTTEPETAGDVCISALSTAEAFFEPGTRDCERAQWWIKATVHPPKQVRRMFGLDEDPEADGKTHVKYDPAAWKDDSQQPADMTLVLTLYERPGPDGPGRVVTVVGDDVVSEKPWPFPFTDHLNVAPITCVPVDNRWIGQTVLWQAISLQVLLNKCESAMAESRETCGKPKPTIPEGSVNADFEWDESPYRPLYWNANGANGAKPGYMDPPPMPDWVKDSPQHYYQAIDDTLGTHAISRGQAPSGVESGVALAFLGEQDDTPVGELARVSAAAWSKVGTMVLELYAEKVVETREASVDQPKGPPQVMEWSGEMLHGQTTATIDPDTVAPMTRGSHAQYLMNLYDRQAFGVLGEKDTTVRFLKALGGAVGSDVVLDDVDHHEAKAQREVAKMFAGVACVPRDFDNHEVMIRVANEARLSARYDEADPDIQQILDDYCLAHQKLAEEEMMMQESRALVDPAMAVAAQAHEPALAGEPDALIQMQAEQEAVTHRGRNVGGGDAPAFPEQSPGLPETPAMATNGERPI